MLKAVDCALENTTKRHTVKDPLPSLWWAPFYDRSMRSKWILRIPSTLSLSWTCFVALNALLYPSFQQTEFEMRLRLCCADDWVECSSDLALLHCGRTFIIAVDPTKLSPGAHYTCIEGEAHHAHFCHLPFWLRLPFSRFPCLSLQYACFEGEAHHIKSNRIISHQVTYTLLLSSIFVEIAFILVFHIGHFTCIEGGAPYIISRTFLLFSISVDTAFIPVFSCWSLQLHLRWHTSRHIKSRTHYCLPPLWSRLDLSLFSTFVSMLASKGTHITSHHVTYTLFLFSIVVETTFILVFHSGHYTCIFFLGSH